MQTKTFFLENLETCKCEFIEWKIPESGPNVDLEELLERIPEMHQKCFKIYNPQKDEYEVLGDSQNPSTPFRTSRNLLALRTIIIKFQDKINVGNEKESESSESNIKERSRERSIKEVIELVKKWRNYHNYAIDGKKRTLVEAASIVGISKKSLDDYYYQLRVGEKHKFDFSSHLDDKVGVLRAFLKLKEPERKANGKNVRQPKKLKIIQEFSKKANKKIIYESPHKNHNKIDEISSPVSIHSKGNNKMEKNETPWKQNPDFAASNNDIFESILGEDQEFWGSPFIPMSQENFKSLEENFLNDFGFNFEEIVVDPFLPFTNLLSYKDLTE